VNRTSPLHARHVAAGAKIVEFGGWDMPLSYPSGTVAEHLACRNDAVVFDVSHLGTVRVESAGSFELLQRNLINDLRKIGVGRAQYTQLCDDVDGSVLDDIIVWWVGEDRFDVMPNASNTSRVVAAIGGEDVTATRAILAVQGPRAAERLASVFPEAAAVRRFRVSQVGWRAVSCTVAGTGYTGEAGVEIAVPVDAGPDLWDAVISAGIMPAGLGARDTLRLEAGLVLHGHELGPGITPLQADLDWVVGWHKPAFRGRAALEAEWAAGPSRILRGLSVPGRRPPRAECPVLIDGQRVGVVTSGNFSPVLEHGIAMAFLPPKVVLGTSVQVDVRGTMLDGTVVPMPFVKH
jgi:aminomethyltransferase